MIIFLNLHYDRDIIIRNLHKEGYREVDDNPYKISLFTYLSKNNEIQIAFLSNTLILITYKIKAGTVLDKQHKSMQDKQQDPLITTLEKASPDAPFLFGVRHLSKSGRSGKSFFKSFYECQRIGYVF